MKALLKTCAIAVALTVLTLPMSTFAARIEVKAPASWFARLGSIIELRMVASSLISLKIPGSVVWLSSGSGSDTGGSGGTSGGQTSGDSGTSGEGESGFVDR